MRVENLKEGMVVKNYKELCRVLECEFKKGNSKKSHLKELERFIKYNIVGQTFYIKEIYRDPKPKKDKRKNNKGANNNKYSKDIEAIVLAMCKETYQNAKYKHIELSVSGFMLRLNMTNPNFNTGKFNMSKLSSYLKIPDATVRDFYNNTSSNFEDCIVRVLKDLENRCLIDWSHILKIQTKSGEYRDATDQEKICIKECEQDILEKMEMKNKSQVVMSGKWNEFHGAVLDLLKDTVIRRYYKAIKVLSTEKFIEILDNVTIEVNDNKFNLNYNIMQNTIKNAKSRQQKAIDTFTSVSFKQNIIIADDLKQKDKARLMNDFVEDIERLTNICIMNLSDDADYINLEKELGKIEKNATYTLTDKELDSDWNKLYVTKNDLVGLFA